MTLAAGQLDIMAEDQAAILKLPSWTGRSYLAASCFAASYFVASCAQFANVVRNGFAAGGGSISPVNAARNVTMWP